MSDGTDAKNATDNKPQKPHAEAPSGIHLSKPLDDMSLASVNVVADAAAIIAQKKLEAAEAKMAAAKAAMERLAAMKAGRPLPPKPEVVAPAPVEVKAEAPEPTPPVVEAQAMAAPTTVPIRKLEPAAEAPPTEAKPLVAEKPLTEVIALPEAPKPALPAQPQGKAAKDKPSVVRPSAPVERPVLEHTSGIVRLAGAIRAKAAAAAPKIPEPTGKRSLDPIANHAGLSRPDHKPPRKIVTPGLIFLLALMTFYALYASGNLPQFDRWTDSVVNDAHQHNDQVVGGILHAGQYILIGGGLLIVLIAVLLIKNYLHQKHNAEHERDFHTR